MPVDPSHLAKAEFFGLLPDEFDALVAQWGWPKFRAKQVRDWVYQKMVTDPRNMTNLSKHDREKLLDNVNFESAEIIRRQDSNDGTRKLLLAWGSANAETVMIPDADRRTACVSSQVGCPVGCSFCASGINGVKGNLTAGQIVEQIYALNRLLAPFKERITNVVFMGMGEPMSNYANVMKAIRILHD